MLWVLYSWNVILGTSTTITTGCHFLLQWFLHGCSQTMPHIMVFYLCLKTGSVAHPISGFNVIQAIHSDILCIWVHLSRYSQSKIQMEPFSLLLRPYSGHLVRRSLYKRHQSAYIVLRSTVIIMLIDSLESALNDRWKVSFVPLELIWGTSSFSQSSQSHSSADMRAIKIS